MELSLSEVATVLAKTERQVRALVRGGKIQAKKRLGRWVFEAGDLPLNDVQRQAIGIRIDAVKSAVSEALRPAGEESR